MSNPHNPFTRTGALGLRDPLFRGRAAELAQLEVRVTVHETRHQLTVRKFEGRGAPGPRHAGIRADGGDSTGVINENGAIVD